MTMEALFLTLVDRSLAAGWLVLAILLLRPLLKKAPRWIHCGLWALVALRLVCPVSLESTLSLIPKTTPADTVVETILDSRPEDTRISHDAVSQAEIAAEPDWESVQSNAGSDIVTAPGPVRESPSLLSIAARLWPVGLTVLLAYALVSYLRLKQKVGPSLAQGDGVFLCDYIDTPFILGIFRPKVYLPSALPENSAAYVLAHERSHLRRRDHWWKPLGYLLLSIYWFHPLLWAAYILLCRDIELACDQRVVRDMEPREKQAYSEALLNCSMPRHLIAACPLAFGEVGVKERVKSVLRYKKPGFWILLISLLLCVMVAVGFLTDPQTTLSDLYPGTRSDISCIDLYSSDVGNSCLTAQRDLEAVWDLLDSAACDPEPYAQEELRGYLDAYSYGDHYIRLTAGDSQWDLYFLKDFSAVGALETEEAILSLYHVRKPEVVEAFFDTYMNPVTNRTVTAQPFYTQGDPHSWTAGLTLSAVSQAGKYSGSVSGSTTSASMGCMSEIRFTEFLEVLNALQETAFGEGEAYHETAVDTYQHKSLYRSNVSISVIDDANGLTGYIRYYQDTAYAIDTLDLILLDKNAQATRWEVQDEALMAFMQEQYTHPLTISVVFGYGTPWQDTDPLTVRWGNVTIQTKPVEGWEYQIQEYTDGAASFGIRCRPEGEEGWIYYSFWPGRYDPQEENRSYTQWHVNGYRALASYPSPIPKTGAARLIPSYTKTQFPTGDSVTVYENVSGWYREYEEILKIIDIYTTCQFGKYIDGSTLAYGDVTVDVSALHPEYDWYWLRYFDWDQIAAQLGVQELHLLDSAEYGSRVFLGLQSGDRYAVAVFRTDGIAAWEFAELLTDPVSLTIGNQVCGKQFRYEAEGEALGLGLICEESVTGLLWSSDCPDYIHLDSCPTLLVFQEDLWETLRLPAGAPALLSRSVDMTRKTMQFGTSEESYLYSGIVSYSDGALEYGGYSLDTEDLARLAELLSAQPEGEIIRADKPARTGKFVEILLYLDDGNGEDLTGSTLLTLHYDGETASITADPAYEGEDSNLYVFIQDKALLTRLESLLDPSRRQWRTEAPGEDVTAEYAWDYASISLTLKDTWEWETVPYTDDATPFGIRFRPRGCEGWIFVQFCPGGFIPDPDWVQGYSGRDLTYYWTEPTNATSLYPFCAEVLHSYPGEYAVTTENADSWTARYRGEVGEILAAMELGAGYLTEQEIRNQTRALLSQRIQAALEAAGLPFDDIYPRQTLTFDFHTGIWAYTIQPEGLEEPLTVLQVDAMGNVLP